MAVVNYTNVALASPSGPTPTGMTVVASSGVVQYVSPGVTLAYPLNTSTSTPTASVFPTASAATKHPKRP